MKNNKSRIRRTRTNPTTKDMAEILPSNCSRRTNLPPESREIGVSDSNHHPLISLPELPSELTTEILLRLPVKPLLKFKCVSKSWKTLISSPNFIKNHLRVFSPSSSEEDRQQQLQLLSGRFDGGGGDFCFYLEDCSLTSLLSDDDAAAKKDAIIEPLPPILRVGGYLDIVGCCDGLFCINAGKGELLLWNPSTRKSQKLPNFSSPAIDLLRREDILRGFGYYKDGDDGKVVKEPIEIRRENYDLFYGFGYDKVSDDYKVVKVYSFFNTDNNPSGSEVIVYSVNTGSWKSIGEFKGGSPAGGYCGSFTNGKIHWGAINEAWSSAVFLDLATETFGRIDLARMANGGIRTLVDNASLSQLETFGADLSLFTDRHRDHVVDLWVMKEYGVAESRTKVVSVAVDKTENLHRVLSIPGSDRLLIVLKDELRLYNPRDMSFKLLSRSGNRNVLSIYVESLVSPNPNAASERQQRQQ